MKTSKSVLLFGVVLAVCAFVVPSMASAASWSGAGTHQLFSPNLSFTAAPTGVAAGSSCAASEFDSDVVSAAVIEITGGSFQNCRGLVNAADCTVTASGTKFPWTATARTTTDIQIHGIHVDLVFETGPGQPCTGFAGAKITLTGTLTGGVWDVPTKEITLNNAPGTNVHVVGAAASGPATVNGTIRDTTGTLNVLD